MRLIVTAQAVIARKARVPLALAITFLHDHTSTWQTLVREAITTVRTTLLSSRAGVHAYLRRLQTVLGMTGHTLHQRGNQATHGMHVDLV